MRASKSPQYTAWAGDGGRSDTRFEEDSQPGQEDGTHQAEPPAYDLPRDRRAKYALQLQRASEAAIRKVKNNPLLVDSEWSEPLTTAPTAISVMAFLLKTAGDRQVAGLEISSLEIKDWKGIKTIGTLPSSYFITNLMHCSDLGRKAFLNAQNRMNKIKSITTSMMADGGKISYIMELLEDPDDARFNLQPAMEDVQAKAASCGNEVTQIKAMFDYWHSVIYHLSTSALTITNRTVVNQREIGNAMVETEEKRLKADELKNAATSEKKELERLLENVALRVSRAQDNLKVIRSEPKQAEPTYYEDRHQARELIPETAAAKIERGKWKTGLSSLFGATRTMKGEDKEHYDSHRARQRQEQDDIIAIEQARRAKIREDAEAELREAKDEEARLTNRWEVVRQQLSDTKVKLSDAKSDLAKASENLKRLGDRKLELDDILEILRNSTQELGKLKDQLEKLVIFFSRLEDTIATTALADVKTFLSTIEQNSIREDDQMTMRKLGRATKQRIMAEAMGIQGQFSAITDVSTAYIKVSDKCIRPAIGKMEQLALAKDGQEWKEKSAEFSASCEKYMSDIDAEFQSTQANMGPNMAKRIGMLQMLAIEAAEDHEGETP